MRWNDWFRSQGLCGHVDATGTCANLQPCKYHPRHNQDYGGDTASGLLAESEPPAERDRAARSAPAPHAGAENGPKTPAAKQALGANPIPAPSGVDGGPP